MKKIIISSALLFVFTILTSSASSVTHVQFKVYGNCEMCKKTIEDGVYRMKGVKKVHWDMETQILHLTYQTKVISLTDIHEGISLLGYATDEVSANVKVYEALPYCCKVEGACTPK